MGGERQRKRRWCSNPTGDLIYHTRPPSSLSYAAGHKKNITQQTFSFAKKWELHTSFSVQLVYSLIKDTMVLCYSLSYRAVTSSQEHVLSNLLWMTPADKNRATNSVSPVCPIYRHIPCPQSASLSLSYVKTWNVKRGKCWFWSKMTDWSQTRVGALFFIIE